MRPLIGITADVDDRAATVRRGYGDAVAAAGGVPVVLVPPDPSRADALAADLVDRLDGVVFSGGPDPRMEAYGEATHPAAKVMHPHRQAFEEALLRALDARRDRPVLGVCLGMQMMALHAGGRMHQHLPEVVATAADHLEDRRHRIEVRRADAVLGSGGEVNSWHRQGVRDAGRLVVVAVAHDGVIEAVRDPDRAFGLGVQWHPERMGPGPLGWDVVRALVDAARGRV
jgi:putative glutamine amidotransferase